MSNFTCEKCGTDIIDSENGYVTDLLLAAKLGAKWMRWWIEQNECECEYGHTCGKNERKRDLEQIESAIAKAAGRQ